MLATSISQPDRQEAVTITSNARIMRNMMGPHSLADWKLSLYEGCTYAQRLNSPAMRGFIAQRPVE
jgi:hypothetical protein